MRKYAFFVGLFGAFWLVYAWFSYRAYEAIDVIYGPKPTAEFAAQVAALRFNVKAAITLFATSAIVAFGSAIGLFLGRPSAKRVWLSWSVFLLLAYVVSLYVDPSSWSDHLELLFMAPLSWWVLREVEAKKRVEP
jgi:hypothetical protein